LYGSKKFIYILAKAGAIATGTYKTWLGLSDAILKL
jgi:hypothetical protein